MSRALSRALDAEQLAVRELARQADPLDMIARLLVAGFVVRWPCKHCGGTGTIPCKDLRHAKDQGHICGERSCTDGRCEDRRRLLLLASIEADRIRHEERGL